MGVLCLIAAIVHGAAAHFDGLALHLRSSHVAATPTFPPVSSPFRNLVIDGQHILQVWPQVWIDGRSVADLRNGGDRLRV